jgi:hypothetical protein
METWSIVGLVAVSYVAFEFVRGIGKTIPILQLLLLVAGLQWILGAFIEYRTDFQHYKYYMYVSEKVYMSYVVPAYIALVLALALAFSTKLSFNMSHDNFHKYSKFGVIILVVGIVSDFIKSSLPNGLQFFFFLLANFKYVGAIILYFSSKKQHKYIFYGTLIYLALNALRGGFFHDLILWGTFFYLFWAYKNKPSFKMNILIIFTGFVMSTFIQVVKSDYRELIWNGYSGSYSSLFFDILSKRLSGGLTENTEEQSELNIRLNQGWIISAIMEHTPRVQEYAEGSTVKDAIFASLLPRFLSPNKKIAGGVENFETYTGIELQKNTSMGMSLVGEGYANFGVIGGVIFMGLWGVVLFRFWIFFMKQIQYNILIVFFLPLIFLQVIKAETELVVVLNHLVKATVLVFLFLWSAKKVFNINFENE